MINKKIIAAFAVLVLGLLPVAKVWAAAYITLNSFSGHATALQISGGGWNSGENINLYLGSASGSPVASVTAGADSFFGPLSVNIPANTPQGALPIIAAGSSGQTETNSYYVVPFSPSITPASSPNTPGSAVAVSGQGFAPGEAVNFVINGSVLGHVVADSLGTFTGSSFTVPNLAPGTYILHGTGASSGADAIYYFYVGDFFPSVSPSVYYLLPGSSLAFSGSGFRAGEVISVTQGSSQTVLSTITADGSGSFVNAGSFNVPLSLAGGVRTYHLKGNSGNTAPDVMVTVGAFNGAVSPSAYFVNPGDVLNFNGSGFAPGETLNVFIGSSSTPSSSFQASSSGDFTGAGSISIPFGFAGTTKTFTLKGVDSGTSASLDITIGRLYPSVSPSAWYVLPGSIVSFSGNGFAPRETVNIKRGSTAVGSVVVNSSGDFDGASSTVPFVAGTQTYTFTGGSSGASAIINLTAASVSPYADAGTYYTTPGGVVNVTGHNFAAGESVVFTVGGLIFNSIADSSGNTSPVPITIPLSSQNPAVVTLTGASSGAVAKVPITLAPFAPQINPSSWYVGPGATVNFTGTGFAPGETVSVLLNNLAVGSTVVTASGTISNLSVQIPFSATAAHFVFNGNITQSNTAVNIGVAQLSPSIWLSTYYDQGGNPMTVFGGGFAGGEKVDVSFNGIAIGSVTADSGGNFALHSTIPFGSAGNKTIQARGESSGVSATAQFTQPQVYAGAQLGSYAGAPGSVINFIGSGYLPNEPIQITTDRTGASPVYTFNSDATGSFNDSGYSIPNSFTGGPLTITITGTHSFTSTSITYYVTGP